jgi:hypothetical protein
MNSYFPCIVHSFKEASYGKAIARPEKSEAGAPPPPKLAVDGPKAFICWDCIGMCISIMGESDPEWRDEKIEHLAGFATGETQTKLEARKEEQLARLRSVQNGEPKTDPRNAPPHEDMPPKDWVTLRAPTLIRAPLECTSPASGRGQGARCAYGRR